MKRYNSVDDYIDGADEWQVELKQLRKILLDSTQLEEGRALLQYNSWQVGIEKTGSLL